MRIIDMLGINPCTPEGVQALLALDRSKMPCSKNCTAPCSDACITKKLFTEIPTKKRWETIKSDEDVKQVLEDFNSFCRSSICDSSCRLHDNPNFNGCVAGYLCEEVEEKE